MDIDSIKKVTLERLQFSAQAVIDLDVLDQIRFTPTFQTWVDSTARHMVLSMKRDVLGQRLTKIHESYPATWWEAVKLRFYPEWLLKRCPPKMQYIIVDAHALYPKIEIPNQEPHIYINKRDFVDDWEGDER